MNSPLYVLLQNMFQEKLFKEDVFYLLGDQLNALFLLAPSLIRPLLERGVACSSTLEYKQPATLYQWHKVQSTEHFNC